MQTRHIVALIASLFIVAGCNNRSSSSQGAVTKQAPASQNVQNATEAGTVKRVWPFIDDASASKAETGTPTDLLAKNYYVVLDGSGSMRDHACSGGTNKMEAAKKALLAFAENIPGNANVGLFVFDRSGLQEVLPIAATNRERFSALVKAVDASGGTPLRGSLEAAYKALTAQGRRQFGYGEYHLVVVTDGEANTGQDPTDVVNQFLKESPVVLHTIGFCIGEQHSLNQPGRVLYRAADNPDQLRQQLADVLAEAPSFDVTQFKQ